MISRRAVIAGLTGLPLLLASGNVASEIPKSPPFYPVPKVSPSPPEQQEPKPEPKEYVGGKVQEYRGGSRLGPEIGLVDYLAMQVLVLHCLRLALQDAFHVLQKNHT